MAVRAMTEDKIKEIRTHLRLAMNGVISTSMREKGIVYKLNFGVPYPEVKQIAALYEKDADLAAALWKEDIREFKMLATMLQPVETFTMGQAKQWMAEIPYLEIAEQCSRNLFSKLSFAGDLTLELINNKKDKFSRTLAFLIWSELFKKGQNVMLPVSAEVLVSELMHTVTDEEPGASLMERQAAISAMKFYGRQSEEQSRRILSGFEQIHVFESRPDLQEIYNELKFEFEYYL